ncbi:hypothetical protein MK079_02820 [Candidatus Gracilibacteria bacterium]|nr:hypothetical protein [Candidatus Gracilibacteria bacterium]
MFELIEEKDNTIIVKMDTNTYKEIKQEFEPEISDYELVFDTPVSTKELLNHL